MANEDSRLSPFFYLGIALVSGCLLAVEIILTRLLSVVFWYHYAFLVVSIALFGLTLGTLIVYLFPRIFSVAKTYQHITAWTSLSSVLVGISIFSLFYVPAAFVRWSIAKYLMPAMYVILTLPFISFGVSLSLIFSRFPKIVSKTYSANFIGASLGCIGVVVMWANSDAVAAVCFVSALLAVAAILFNFENKRSRTLVLISIIIIIGYMLFSLYSAFYGSIRPLWVKGCFKKPPLYSTWNIFSYLTVRQPSRSPFGWGMSTIVNDLPITTQELMLTIDEGAGTVLTKFNSIKDMEYVKYDVSAIAHYLRPVTDILVVGAGGGRDLLTALLFGAKKIVGVEINKDIKDITYNKLNCFSGKIKEYPQINYVVDEARTFVARSQEQYDIIQASLIDSWAAFTNSAFALTENSLYTRQAWVTFLQHLKDNGILTFSRWYRPQRPLEIYRLVSLARAALRDIGVSAPWQHIIVVRYIPPYGGVGVGTILVSKSQFLNREIIALRKVCQSLKFQVALSPHSAIDKNFIKILHKEKYQKFFKQYPYDVRPPSDDRPFFFYFWQGKDIFFARTLEKNSGSALLRRVLIFLCICGSILFIVPFAVRFITKDKSPLPLSRLAYFSAIGLGFMLVELSFMQRLGMFLGHPVYGFTVVLFSLFLFCGLGSFVTRYFKNNTTVPCVVLSLLAFISSVAVPIIIEKAITANLYIKILVSIALLGAWGMALGMPFPLGMARAEQETEKVRLVYWGVNGFMSVLGAAVAVVFLIIFGFRWTLIVAGVCYFSAAVSLYNRAVKK